LERPSAPAWRIAGSFVSWALFAFAFGAFFQTAGVVCGLGGFCASGGPYVISTECPETVVVFAPVGIFGSLIAVGIGLFVARSFGTPLVLWAWPIAFVSLGVQFMLGATEWPSMITNILLGLMFIVFGAVPLWFTIRGGVQPFVLGLTNPMGQPFAYRDTGRKSYFGPRRQDGEQIPATPADWALSLGILVVAAGLGGWLSVLAFNAVGSAG
jgi:hypothetical protein